MRLETFLVKEGRSQVISEEGFKDMLTKKCKKAWSAYQKSSTIYRGISEMSDAYAFVDPKGSGERKSRWADGNYYTILLDNLPSWKRYPKRKNSVVCTTGHGNAQSRGGGRGTYIVFPFDGADIAICPNEDIWISFSNIQLNSWNGGDLNMINHWMNRLNLKDNNSLIGELKKITNKNFSEEDLLNTAPKILKRHVKNWLEEDDEYSLWDWFDVSLDPKNNGFRIEKVGTPILDKNVEVWTDSKCLLLNTNASKVLNEI